MTRSRTIAQELIKLVNQGADSSAVAEQYIAAAKKKRVLYQVPLVLHHLALLGERESKRREVVLKTAKKIGNDIKKQILTFLNAPPNSKLSESEDPELLAGFVATYDNTIYDASAKGRLRSLRKSLVTASE